MSQTKSFDIDQLACLSDEAFIHHCFVRACRRICSPSRAKHYLAVLASGTCRGEVARSIMLDDECTHQSNTVRLRRLLLLNGELFLHKAYREILGRPIDKSGLEHYSQCLSKGERKERILYDLATSYEGQARRIQYSELNDLVVSLAEQDDFRRPIALKDVRHLLSLKDDEFVQKAYKLVLKREPDATGLSVYLHALRNGLSKIRVLRSLACSDEGRRFQKTLPVRLYLEFWWLFK